MTRPSQSSWDQKLDKLGFSMDRGSDRSHVSTSSFAVETDIALHGTDFSYDEQESSFYTDQIDYVDTVTGASKTEDVQAKARLKALSAPDDPEIKAYNWNTICDVASIQTSLIRHADDIADLKEEARTVSPMRSSWNRMEQIVESVWERPKELNRSLDFENAEALTENPQQKNRRRWKSKLDSEDWYTRCARLYDTSFWIAKLPDGRLKRVDKYLLTKAGVRWVNHCLGLNWDKHRNSRSLSLTFRGELPKKESTKKLRKSPRPTLAEYLRSMEHQMAATFRQQSGLKGHDAAETAAIRLTYFDQDFITYNPAPMPPMKDKPGRVCDWGQDDSPEYQEWLTGQWVIGEPGGNPRLAAWHANLECRAMCQRRSKFPVTSRPPCWQMFDARFCKDPTYVPEPVPEWLRQAQGNYDIKHDLRPLSVQNFWDTRLKPGQ